MMNTMITVVAVFLLLGLFQLYLGLKAQRKPNVTGEKMLIGETGIIRKSKGFRRRAVLEIRGELWWCIPVHPELKLEKGMTVRITGLDDDSMILKVEETD